jgi:glycerol-3-phosphate acyltransferase PlsX
MSPLLKDKIKNQPELSSRIKIVHAPKAIGLDEAPTLAVFHQKDSSLVASLRSLRTDPSVTTGSFLWAQAAPFWSGSVVKIGKLDGVSRPAFCPLLPTMDQHFVAVCDSGASSECTKEELLQFGIMASEYLKKAYGIASPARRPPQYRHRRGERRHPPERGLSPISKPAPPSISSATWKPANSRAALTTSSPAMASAGNVLIKATEGNGDRLIEAAEKDLLQKPQEQDRRPLPQERHLWDQGLHGLQQLWRRGDARALKKIVIKGHGSGNSLSVYRCIEQAYNASKNHLVDSLKDSFKA